MRLNLVGNSGKINKLLLQVEAYSKVVCGEDAFDLTVSGMKIKK
jgi:hypothetical protein